MSTLPPGIICTIEDYIKSINDPSSLYCLTRGDGIGLTITAAAGLFSLVALLYVFWVIFSNLYHYWRTLGTQIEVFQEPLDVLMLALFTTDTLQAIGGILNIHWINIAKVEVGNFCNTQGIIQNVGETGVALSNIWITSFTLYSIWTGREPSMRTTYFSVGGSSVFIILIVTLSNVLHAGDKSKFITPTPYWCWISKDYFSYRLFSEYLWLWISLFWSILAYILLFFLLHDRIETGDRWWKISFKTRTDGTNLSRAANTMLWYPLTYGITILPMSVIRWIGFVQEHRHGTAHIPASATFTVAAIFTLSGLFNVILLVTTRPEAGLFSKRLPQLPSGGSGPTNPVAKPDEQQGPYPVYNHELMPRQPDARHVDS